MIPVVLHIPHNPLNFIIPTLFSFKIQGAFRFKVDLYYESVSFQGKYLYIVFRSVRTLLHLS